MNKLTADDILDLIKEAGISVRDFAHGYFDGTKIEGVGPYITVDKYGGEGKGEEWYSVKHFTDHDIYIKTEGWYSSYEGTEFDNGYGHEVRPEQVTITVYN